MLNQNKIHDHQCGAHLMEQSMAMSSHMIFEDLKAKVFNSFRIWIFNSKDYFTLQSLHFDGPVVPDEQNIPIASFSASTRSGL